MSMIPVRVNTAELHSDELLPECLTVHQQNKLFVFFESTTKLQTLTIYNTINSRTAACFVT